MVAIEDWLSHFSNTLVQHLPHSISNHCPFLVDLQNVEYRMHYGNFKFEAWWTMEGSFENEVLSIWNLVSSDIKLNRLRLGLRRWVTSIWQSRTSLKEQLNRKLELLMNVDRDDDLRRLLSGMERSISVEEYTELTQPFFEEEVFVAMNGMGSTKASGLMVFRQFFPKVLGYNGFRG